MVNAGSSKSKMGKIKIIEKKCLTEPFPLCIKNSSSALVAQLDRATGYEPVGREFESLQARHIFQGLMKRIHKSFFVFLILLYNTF